MNYSFYLTFPIIYLFIIFFFRLYRWEGFLHVALCYWNQNKKQPCYGSGIVYDMCMTLLHVAFGLIGDSDSTFRKACLAAGISLPSYSNDWLDLNQQTIFCHLIAKINTESRFSEALSNVEAALQKKEDPFQRFRWLWTFNQGGSTCGRHDLNMHFTGIMNLFPLSDQDKCEVECSFMQIKSRFCCDIIFDDVKQSFKILLEKYRKVRKQYMNGMISLHYGSWLFPSLCISSFSCVFNCSSQIQITWNILKVSGDMTDLLSAEVSLVKRNQ